MCGSCHLDRSSNQACIKCWNWRQKDQIILATGRGILADFWVPHEIDRWNFQHMLNLWFSEASQNLSSYNFYFHCFIGGTNMKNSKNNEFTFLFLAMSKKKNETMWNFRIKIIQPFLYLEGAAQKFTGTVFNPTTKIFQFDTNFNIRRSVQMTWSPQIVDAIQDFEF